MRIVHLVDYFQPRLGYQEYYLAKEHQEMGHQVVVVTSDRYFPFPDYERTVARVLGPRKLRPGRFVEDGLSVWRLPVWVEYARSSQVVVRDLDTALRALRPEVVHCHGVFTPSAFLATWLKRALGYVLVYDNHAGDFNTNLHGTPLKRLYYRTVLATVIIPKVRAEADCIVAVGDGQQILVCREFGLRPEQVPVIPLGADTERFSFDPAKRREARRGLGIADSDVVAVHAGKLTPNKDVHLLLEAMAPLMRQDPGLKLLLVGNADHSYRLTLEAAIGGADLGRQVTWKGMVPASELPGIYCAADIGVWPGNHSNSIEEAMSVGLPVVLPESISRETRMAHLLSNGNGLGFPRGNVEALGERIRLLAGDPALRKLMGSRSRQLVERELSVKVMARRFMELYRSALGARDAHGSGPVDGR